MSQVAVRQLKFRGDIADAAPTEFRIIDALRTEITASERIVIVRQMKLGNVPADWRSRGLADQVGRAWHGILAAAVHGCASNAASANCIWFTDAAEARTALMALLAAGHHPTAWYWRHVVPDWAGQPIDPYLTALFARAIAAQDEAACIDIIEHAIAGGAMPSLLRAIAALTKFTVPAVTREAPRNFQSAFRTEIEKLQASENPETDEPSNQDMLAAAKNILSGLSPLMLRAIRELVSLPAVAPILPPLAAILVERALPDTLANTPLFQYLVSTTKSLLEGRPSESAIINPRRLPHLPPANRSDETELAKQGKKGDPVNQFSAKIDFRTDKLIALADEIKKQDAHHIAEFPDSFPQQGMTSDAAGLFLLVNALRILGWREWLALHPQWLLHRPSAALMNKVAKHYRVSAGDPARQIWAVMEPMPAQLDEALTLWRRGLDGWLRRRTGKRLAAIVSRRGWIIQESERISVRFRLRDIDIGMRRHALDRDPGWTDWLGFSLRYYFDDRPVVSGLLG